MVAEKEPEPVVESVKVQNIEENKPLAGELSVYAAPKYVAIPVREQAAPSARTEQRTERAGLNSAMAPAELVLTHEGDVWYAAVQQLLAAEAIAALVRELALQSQLVARTSPSNDGEPHDWLLRIERESLSQSGSREKLQVALETLGHSVRQRSRRASAMVDSSGVNRGGGASPCGSMPESEESATPASRQRDCDSATVR
mgnify:CR=1 FL=1